MKDSAHTAKVKEAYRRGYRVNEIGDVIGLSNQILKLTKTTSGYYSFNIRYNSKPTRVIVHKLQAYQKYGDKSFEKGIVVRHYNGNSLDNSKGNILIGTQKDNMQDKPKEQRIKDASHPQHDHNSIINDRISGMTYKEIMEKYNISSKGTVSFIITTSLKSKEV